MPEKDPEQLSSEDREALGVGRVVLWVKKNWQFLALAGFIGGPNALAMLKPEPAAVMVSPPSISERMAVVETELKNLSGQFKDMNGKLDRVLRRQEPDPMAGSTLGERLASIENGDVSRALRNLSTPTPGPLRVTP